MNLNKESISSNPLDPEMEQHPLLWLTGHQALTLENLQASYIKKAAESLNPFFAPYLPKESKIDPIIGQMFENYQQMLSGGRKIRGLMMVVAFSAVYGDPSLSDEIIKSSLAYEMIHNAFLIHDDIEDNSPKRRNKDTIHVLYQKWAEKVGIANAQNFGRAIALNVGDKGPALAYLMILDSNFPDSRKIAAAKYLSQIISETVNGQGIDLAAISLEDLTRRKINQIDIYKTAQYTFTGPLKLGAILAGATRAEQQMFVKFSLPLGIAFQIHDDIAGIFGDEKEVGKPTDSDLKEAKKTLLFWYAHNHGNNQDRQILKSAWGNNSISDDEVSEVKEILLKTGALEHSFEYARALVSQAKKFIPRISSNSKIQSLFEQIADFSINNYPSVAKALQTPEGFTKSQTR